MGGSCGMAMVAALQVAEREGPDALVVVLLPDGGRGYLGKIFNDDWMSSYGFLRTPLEGERAEPTVGDVLRGKSGVLPVSGPVVNVVDSGGGLVASLKASLPDGVELDDLGGAIVAKPVVPVEPDPLATSLA